MNNPPLNRDGPMLTPPEVSPSELSAESAAKDADPALWVQEYGDVLFRVALGRVRRPEVAEDLVQEAFLAAWQSRQRFAGRSSRKTWLLRILSHKIVDYFRRTNREVQFADADELASFEAKQFEAGESGGTHWDRSVAPRGWRHPAQSLENAEFWAVFHDCTERLPERVGRVFVMREVDGLETGEICQTLNIKQSHLFVMLHRARLALRRCLELNWFRTPPRRVTKPD